jgi:hypothetical protein
MPVIWILMMMLIDYEVEGEVEEALMIAIGNDDDDDDGGDGDGGGGDDDDDDDMILYNDNHNDTCDEIAALKSPRLLINLTYINNHNNNKGNKYYISNYIPFSY